MLQPPQRGFARTTNELYFGNPAVDSVSIAGPLCGPRAPTTRPAAATVFMCRPTAPRTADEACARRILSTLARRAYRRSGERQRPRARCSPSTVPGEPRTDFDAGIQRGLRRILASPTLSVPHRARARARRRRCERRVPGVSRERLDLASRLSFFLWSSIPDEELLDAGRAAARSAIRPTLERQVRRMLADRRAQALVDNFASQWLTLGKLAGVVPDVDAYPEFDENLRDAFRQETRLFVAVAAARGPQRHRSAHGQLHVRQRAARPPLSASRTSTAATSGASPSPTAARRTARPGQHPDRHVVSEPHVAGAARPLAARQHPRRTAAAAAARRAVAAGRRRRRQADVDPRADGGAPEESVVRGVPRADGSARVLARELRRARQVAHDERRHAGRRVWRAPRRHAVRGRRRPAATGREPSGGLRAHVHAEAARLRARAEPRGARSARRPRGSRGTRRRPAIAGRP